VKAENEKIAAINSVIIWETATNCVKRGKIKEAERFKQSKILHAKGEAEAIKLVNANVVQKCFYTFFCFNFRK